MDFNNKTILITGLVICSLFAMYLSFEDIALAIVSGLVGYLSKDILPNDTSSSPLDSNISPVATSSSPVDEQISPLATSSDPVDMQVAENMEDIQNYGSDSETA